MKIQKKIQADFRQSFDSRQNPLQINLMKMNKLFEFQEGS